MAKDEKMSQYKKALIADDLARARASGKSYNEYFSQRRKEQLKQGALTEDEYKKGIASELYTPKQVREAYEKDPKFFEKSKEQDNKTIKKAKGGKVSSASKRADGCAIRGKTRA